MSSKAAKSELYSVAPERNSVVYIADLARALEILKPKNDVTQAAIGRILGFEWIAEKADVEQDLTKSEHGPQETPPGPDTGLPLSAPSSEVVPPVMVESSPSQQPTFEERGNWLPVMLSVSGGDGSEQMQLHVLPPSAGNEKYIPPPLEPLLAPRLTRGILSGALSTISEDGPVDLDELVRMIARRERLEQVPRLAVPTLRRGVQLLVDRGEEMTPFAPDQRWLEKRVREVVGPELLEIIRFSGCPTRTPKSRPWLKSKPYAFPHPGTLIMLMTDLGIRQLRYSQSWASEQEWADYLLGARRAGCPVLALVPYAADRWPSSLTRLCKIIQWDRNTTARSVRSVVGTAHEAGR